MERFLGWRIVEVRRDVRRGAMTTVAVTTTVETIVAATAVMTAGEVTGEMITAVTTEEGAIGEMNPGNPEIHRIISYNLGKEGMSEWMSLCFFIFPSREKR